MVQKTIFFRLVPFVDKRIFKRYAINTLRVDGSLTMDRPFGKDAMPYEKFTDWVNYVISAYEQF